MVTNRRVDGLVLISEYYMHATSNQSLAVCVMTANTQTDGWITAEVWFSTYHFCLQEL